MAKSKSIKGLKVRPVEPHEINAVYRCQLAAYEGIPPHDLCDERLLSLQQQAFPEGFMGAFQHERLIGYSACLIVQLDADSPWYSYDEITGGGAFTTHNPSGDTLYGADIAVHPDFRGRGVSKALYQARKKLLKRLNLRRMVAGGRIPGYEPLANLMTAQEYVDKVVAGELTDSSLNAHLRAGYRVNGVHHGYLDDQQSLNFATFLEFENPHFRPERHHIAAAPLKRRNRKIRLCLAQHAFPRFQELEQLFQEVERIFAEAEPLKSHLIQLPGDWWAGLPDNCLQNGSERIEQFFLNQAQKHGIFIATGAYPRPAERGESLASALYGPEGGIGYQSVLHFSTGSNQRNHSSGLTVFDTGLARIGILDGHDLLYPELTRRLTLGGLQLLLCPIAAKERNEYIRLRYCAQARAVENTIFVALCNRVGAGSLSYGESMILTPCDFGFPDSGIAARAGTSSGSFVVHDLDMGALESAREIGSVTPLKDRRLDVCALTPQVKVKKVKVH